MFKADSTLFMLVAMAVTSHSFILNDNFEGECFDKLGSCASYGADMCSRNNGLWARVYCQAHCGHCDTSKNTHSHGCLYKDVTYHEGQTWEDGCDYKCRCVDASNNFFTCTEYCLKHETEDMADGCHWEKVPFECCEVELCPNKNRGVTRPAGGNTSATSAALTSDP
ncbi:CCN family member 4-like [Haliotis rufescens]|uniref:CCN family member 4-like n=1 Tax=Haliotis rufescens TaxID=6454 RepID=UPI001EB07595|nr:CCN family member 4-like [Haliotis rufescens]